MSEERVWLGKCDGRREETGEGRYGCHGVQCTGFYIRVLGDVLHIITSCRGRHRDGGPTFFFMMR